ncbi:MAG TPA: hypothetical protein VLE73_01990 [Candidatus Saccharimonadales bacterium]|nr:hypothetical protein [Candidatus Saccharimonadales bacterium]
MKRSHQAGLVVALTTASLVCASSPAEAPARAEPATTSSIAPETLAGWLACGLPERMVLPPARAAIRDRAVLLIADTAIEATSADNAGTYRVLTFPDLPNVEEGIAFDDGTSVQVAALTQEAQHGGDGVHHVQVPLSPTDQYVVGVALTPQVLSLSYMGFEAYKAEPLVTAASGFYSTQTPEGAAEYRSLLQEGVGEC